MPKALFLATIGGLASAVLSLSFFGPAPLVAVGLGLGSAWAPIAAAIGALAIIVSASGLSAIAYIVSTAIPAVLISHFAMAPQSPQTAGGGQINTPGIVLSWLTIYGLVMLGVLLSGLFGVGPQLENAMEQTFRHFFTQLYEAGRAGGANNAANVDQLARFAGTITAGAVCGATMTVIVINAVFAQALLAKTGHALRPSPSYIGLQLPRWMPALAVICGILALFPGILGKTGLNALIFLSIPFILVGLTVIHTLARRAASPGAVLTAFYVSLFFIGGIVGLTIPMLGILAVIGLTEQGIGIRGRLKPPAPNQEDE